MQPAEEILNIEYHVRPMILIALNKHPDSRVKAAGELGITSRTLHRYMKQYNIKRETRFAGRYYFDQSTDKKMKAA